MRILEYLDASGRSAFRRWFDRLDAPAAAKVTIAVTRIALDNMSNVKGVGHGVFECRIDFGPGYRVYFGRDGDVMVILLGGGTKDSPEQRYRCRPRAMGRLQAPKEGCDIRCR